MIASDSFAEIVSTFKATCIILCSPNVTFSVWESCRILKSEHKVIFFFLSKKSNVLLKEDETDFDEFYDKFFDEDAVSLRESLPSFQFFLKEYQELSKCFQSEKNSAPNELFFPQIVSIFYL